MFAGDKILAGRHDHPVYAFHRVHVAYLLREILGDDARTDYLVDALLAALAARRCSSTSARSAACRSRT